MSLPQHSRNPSNGHLCCWKPAVVTFFLFFVLSFALSSTPLFSAIRSKLSWENLSPSSWFCPRVPLSSMKMSGMAELVVHVHPEELSLWGYGKGRRRLRRLGVGGRPLQVQTMTRKLLWGSSRSSWGEEFNLGSVVSNPLGDLGRALNSQQKNGSYISLPKRGIISKLKSCI